MPADVVAMRAGDMRADALGFDVELVTGIDLLGSIERAALVAWARDGVDYIQAVPQHLLRQLPAQLAEIAASGGTWRQLREQLRGELGVGERDLELIARDQVAKLNSRVTQSMHEAAGVSQYIWRANNDERVRASHRAADGTVVDWDGPGVPGVGFYGEPAHAGQAGQCRCTAEPVVVL